MGELAVYSPIFPELLIAVSAMVMLMIGAFSKDTGEEGQSLYWIGIVVLVVTAGLVAVQPSGTEYLFQNAFISDPFCRFMKLLILASSVTVLLLSFDYLRDKRILKFEYPVLILLATAGMMMMVSANDLIALYLGLELQSLSLYVLAAIHRDNLRSSEAGLKYFVLGALSSGMLLYGASLIYGFTGSTDFDIIARVVAAPDAGQNIGLIFGLVFLLVGLAFKISAVPFHMWTPDVYEGAPTPVTAFFSAAPKLAAMALLIRALGGAFPGLEQQWQQIIVFIAIASMLLGAFAAIGQNNIKRLLAYSSIGHVGYALVGLSAGNVEGVKALLIYLAIYMVMTLGAFACVLAMRRKDRQIEDIDELAGLAQSNLPMAFVLAMLVFSLAGIPPLAGFFGKFYVFAAAVKAELYTLAVIGVLASVVGAYYYLRIVKIMFFDEPKEKFSPIYGKLKLVMVVVTIFIVGFVILPAPLVDAAAAAAKSFSF